MAKAPLRPARTSQFKRDYKRCKKRRYDMAQLRAVMESLIAGEPLRERHRDHELSGKWKGHRACHIRADWDPDLSDRRRHHHFRADRHALRSF
ncbi:MAG: type II toxin-antitoxin system YafQ family toxin [Acidobacteriota bacterium]